MGKRKVSDCVPSYFGKGWAVPEGMGEGETPVTVCAAGVVIRFLAEAI